MKELKKIQEHRERIEDILKSAREKQFDLQTELESHQTLNKQLINQMSMLRDNEYLRERLAHKEFDKLDNATTKIQDKADSLARFKDHMHSFYTPLPAYHPAYLTPRIEKTKIIEHGKSKPSSFVRSKCKILINFPQHCLNISKSYALPLKFKNFKVPLTLKILPQTTSL